jgi:hypothetical protein
MDGRVFIYVGALLARWFGQGAHGLASNSRCSANLNFLKLAASEQAPDSRAANIEKACGFFDRNQEAVV